MSKIIGVTVGTPISARKIDEELNPVKSVNRKTPDENGNVEIEISEKVFDWAKAELPFTENEISGVHSGGGFVVNPTNFADGKTYFRYHAGLNNFAWTNPNPQKGALTIAMRGYSQYSTTLSTGIFAVYTDGTESRILLTHGETVTYTTDPNKTVDYIRGNYDFENWVLLDMDVLSIVADYPAPTGMVKSVNGNLPDENGNVEIEISEGGIAKETDPTVPSWAKQPQKPTYTPQEIGAQPKGDYLTKETDPTVPAWAKAETKPTYTPQEIGAQPAGDYALKSEIPTVPVQSVNGKTGAVKLNASDVGADESGTAESNVSAHNISAAAHNDIRQLISGLNSRLNALADSDDTTLDQMSELVAYIKENKSLIDSITTNKVNVADIVNNLTTNVTNKPLSAAQGVALKKLIDTLGTGKLDAAELPEAINTALTQAKASGEFKGETGKSGVYVGSGPVPDGCNVQVDPNGEVVELVEVDAGLTKSGYAADAKVVGERLRTLSSELTAEKTEREQAVADLNARLGQQNLLIAEGETVEDALAWLEANGDKTKAYLLPDDFFYAYRETTEVGGPGYENKLPLALASGGGEYVGAEGEDGYNPGFRYSSSSNGEKSADAKYAVTGYIRAFAGDIVRIKNVTQATTKNDGNAYATVYFFASDYSRTTGSINLNGTTDSTYVDGVYTFTVPDYAAIAFFRATLIDVTPATIITVNEEITEGGTVVVEKWTSTGHTLVQTDCSKELATLFTITDAHTAEIDELKEITESMRLLTAEEKLERIKKWDAPIYDANIQVFELSAEKAAITESEKTVAGVYAKYDALMAKHPQYITKTDLGVCSDGVTHVYRYDFREPEPHRGVTGAKEWSETKAKAIIVSGIHWEWGGIFALYNALEEIAENPALYPLRRNTHLIVLPVCNPYAVANMSVRNANQVEIHRNFEVEFIYPGEPGYIEIGERSHGGTEPLSEVETQYIDTIFQENTDAALFLTCHSNQTDNVYGTGFTWASPATYYMCNMHYRLVDKLSAVWMDKYGDDLAAGIADYRTENTPEWDNRLGSAYLSTTNGTETKQATKYGIQATNIEITDAFVVHGTKANPEPALSSFTMSRGAEVYANFLLTAFGCYDQKDKKEYYLG